MLRLLLPGIRLKRWLLLHFLGMCLFAMGLWLLIIPNCSKPIQLHMQQLEQIIRAGGLFAIAINISAILLVLSGIALIACCTHKMINALPELMHPQINYRRIIRALMEKHHSPAPLKIVGIGGGTGLSTLLRGLKIYPVDLTAIVTVADDGGSSGRLRSDLDMPPPGDIRNCLIALAEVEPDMEALFQHRFAAGNHQLSDHSVGNLIIAGLNDMTGDFLKAIQMVSRVLAVRGKVIPSAGQALVLHGLMIDGTRVQGESAITAYPSPIVSISIEPEDVAALPEAVEAIENADLIIVGPGSVYSSILPNLAIPGISQALLNSPAKKCFVCNVMTQPGESDDFTASRHLEAILAQLPYANPFHYAVVNQQRPDSDVIDQYLAKKQFFVEPDLERIIKLGSIPITADLLASNGLARHNPEKLALAILRKIAEDPRRASLLHKKTLPINSDK